MFIRKYNIEDAVAMGVKIQEENRSVPSLYICIHTRIRTYYN